MPAVKRKPPRGTPSPLKGKTHDDWVAQTFIHYPGHKCPHGKHYSYASALNQFVRAADIFYREEYNQHRVTVETRWGVVIFDTGEWAVVGDMTPKEIRQRALDVLAQVLLDKIPHAAGYGRPDTACGVLFDRPCTCMRGKLLKLLEDAK